jgi:hypothetical protein
VPAGELTDEEGELVERRPVPAGTANGRMMLAHRGGGWWRQDRWPGASSRCSERWRRSSRRSCTGRPVADFLAGNPQEGALPGFLAALARWSVPQDPGWFGYKMPDPRAREASAAALRERLGLAVEAGDVVLPRSPIADDVAFAALLARRDVYVLPGKAVEMPGYLRLSLTATDAMIERALPVFADAIRDVAVGRG